MEDAYKSAVNELKKKSHYGGPDYEVRLGWVNNAWGGLTCMEYMKDHRLPLCQKLVITLVVL